MSKIKQFDKPALGLIRKDLDAALKTVGDKYNISLSIGSIGYQADSFSARLKATINDASGTKVSASALELKKYSKSYLGAEFDATKTYIINGKPAKIVGLNMRKRKYPVEYQEVQTGKIYLTTLDAAKVAIDPTYKPFGIKYGEI